MQIIFTIFIYIFISKSLLYADINKQEYVDETSSAVIFTYHRFGNKKYPSTNIRLEQFEKQLEYIEKNNFNVWPLSKIIRHIVEDKKIPQKTVALTMDDAYISVYTEAYPRLKAKNFPFTVFVNTNAVDVKSKNYVSWDNMREMGKYGAEFANHSLTHAYLLPNSSQTKEKWKKHVTREIEGAQKRLHAELGDNTNENPKLFSYPFGEYDKNVVGLLKELGYAGVTQVSGVLSGESNLGIIPRFAMAEIFGDIKAFSLKINTRHLPIESCSPCDTIVTTNNPPLLQLKLKKPIKNLNCFTANGESIDIKWISKIELEVQSKQPLKPPRDRYTCTAPSKDGRWHWFSKMWIIK